MALTRAGSPWYAAPWFVPVAGLLAVAGVLVAVIAISGQVGGDEVPPAAPRFELPDTGSGSVRSTVKEVVGTTIVSVEDTLPGRPAPAARETQVTPGTMFDALVPMDASGLQPGQWINVIGIPNEVRTFSIHALVAFEEPGEPVDGGVRTAAGFFGHEAAYAAGDRVLLGGSIARVDGSRVTLDGPAGPTSLELTSEAPLYRMERGELARVGDGDRIAVAAGDDGAPRAILVQPGR